MTSNTSISKESLHQKACEARKGAYAPYSGYQIGAALRLSNDAVVSGGNMENASYGGTVCAERVAIWKGLHENPGTKIREIVVVSDAATPWPPCGMCRQVIAEFADAQTVVHVGDLTGIRMTYPFAELLPHAFSPEFLKP